MEQIKQLVDGARKIVVIQADNPDGDSLGSALALEEIFGEMGREVHLYCAVDVPDYLKHLKGWDRVSKDLPTNFDLSVIVDTSANILLEKLNSSEYRGWVASRPVIIIDHHSDVECDIPYATEVLNDRQAVATGEVIYRLAGEFGWPLNLQAKSHIASSILADSLGLSSEGTTAATYRVMADLIEAGVDRPALEEARRLLTKMPLTIYRYKGDLIRRTALEADGRLAIVSIPQDELTKFSPLYNPAPLIQNDMLQIEGVRVAIVLKNYDDGKVTGSIRCGYGTAIAADLAEEFGGGGHVYASGFKLQAKPGADDVRRRCIDKTAELLDKQGNDS